MPWPSPRRALAVALVVLGLAALTGCGSGDPAITQPPPAREATRRAALAGPPVKDGEIVLTGELSPATHGPLTLDGGYRVRFEQVDPEDPKHDFSGEVPFSATLDPSGTTPGSGGIELFGDATRTGETTIEADGRYDLNVAFGDFPYVVRFTPVDGQASGTRMGGGSGS